MKKFIWTVIATVITTVIIVYAFNTIVVDHFGCYNYPEWICYALLCACAYIGGAVGDKLSRKDIHIHFKKKNYITVRCDK